MAQRTDEDIKLDVVSQLQWDDGVDAAGITVTVRDGKVHLAGTVPEYRARRAALNDVMKVRGVRAVEDRLTVAFAGDRPVPGDGEIATLLQEAVRREDDLDGDHIDIAVTGGTVTLEGPVESYWEKKKIENIAAAVYGIREIVNNLIVTPTETVEDKAVANALNTFLEASDEIEPGTVEVWVEDGIVRLAGTVPGPAAYQAAIDAAERTPGVREIHDNLTVA